MAIITTTPQAISRKLSALNFERANNAGIGFVVYETDAQIGFGTEICVTNFGYDNGYRSNIAQELTDAGYAIEVVVDNAPHNGRSMTSLIVLGKVA